MWPRRPLIGPQSRLKAAVVTLEATVITPSTYLEHQLLVLEVQGTYRFVRIRSG